VASSRHRLRYNLGSLSSPSGGFPLTPRPLILDVGCGRNKRPGAVGVDHNRNTDADVLADINRGALPFRDDIFERVWLVHVIEHVADVVATIEEVHRLTRPGGLIVIETPHYTDFSSFCDPTHRWHLNTFSFRYFTEDGGFSYYSQRRLRERRLEVKLLRLWRLLGFEWLVSHSRGFRKFWEHYLCFVVRGKAMVFEFEVIK
jgi:SAM-dependent methyltransferase